MFTRQMLLNPKHRDNVKDIVLFIVCKMYFPMVLSRRSTRRDLQIQCAIKGITSSLECVDLATFTFASFQIRSCLLCEFISLGAKSY